MTQVMTFDNKDSSDQIETVIKDALTPIAERPRYEETTDNHHSHIRAAKAVDADDDMSPSNAQTLRSNSKMVESGDVEGKSARPDRSQLINKEDST